MSKLSNSYFKAIGLFIAVASALMLCSWGISVWMRPVIESTPIVYDAAELEAIHLDRSEMGSATEPPVVQVDVDYTIGHSAAWYPKGESPILAELVERGDIPAVEERVGEEPVVLQGPDGVGRFGGTLFRVASSSSDVSLIGDRLAASTLVRWSPMGYPVRPHIAKSWESSEDRREWTFHLRKGMKWSDGSPFTSDDIHYWWAEEQYFNSRAPSWMIVGGEAGDVVKVDAYTVKFTFPKPYGNFLEMLANPVFPYSPKHYLEPYHPEWGDSELIEKAMQARGFSTARALYFKLKNFRNPEHPRIWPWVYRTYQNNPPESFVRNPYYWAVDEAGNQLPYLDRILFSVKAPKLIPVAAAAGEMSMQARHVRFSDYTLLMENRERNHFQVYHWLSADRSAWALWPNQNRYVDPEDPSTALKAELLRDKRFRQALSLAIDRENIISAVYSGFGEPAQIAPGKGSPYFSEKLLHSFTEFDPERANAMLDALGLVRDEFSGMRTFSDGSPMTWYIDYTDYTGEGPVQFVINNWAEVGIRAVPRERSRPLFWAEKSSLQHDFTVWSGMSEYNPTVGSRSFVADSAQSHFAMSNAAWFLRGGLYGDPRAQGGEMVEPVVGSPIRRAMELREEAIQATTDEAQMRLYQEILEIAAENLWSISIATPPPQPVLVKDGLRNVAPKALVGYTYMTPGNTGVETYYYDEPTESPEALLEIQDQMTRIVPEPQSVSGQVAELKHGKGIAWWFGRGLMLTLLAVFVFSAVKFPYIGKRFIILIPTLSVVSLVIFYIIQLPPGDYVETRILQLRLTGDEAAIEQVEELRQSFHLDEPFFQQYSRWIGLTWFTSFDEGDKGLLQGYMGRSMETETTVNSLVGDRLILTLLVSFFTVMFTWALAIPIGIYSAVRQYSFADYIFTTVGFIGMCVPNFLLAIVLMYWSTKDLGVNVTGLFSPEYAAMPGWSWGKVLDLMTHIWVPVIVIGTAGTAGMIRVMRGNLLDELRKPYVTTALAKGVRPFRLLMKYPVRLALNPFISGIGSIFPQLISGGAIIAIVLSLPMLGPLLLQGLMTQDVYLAGSMLMVLSLLGVFGTLVSDLLLLWLDPRIRMEGGAK
ncbi:ABC transporter substrate-binding protein [Coraliomargarita algicola]|uniref:ABC transporter substrate-binding protein n=1 Tax=Coraliomargarita algicola TaxID=3092156 RepID=A0ABZ0RJD4_9BACT|nr:ABC transporter substrate-binding protein [Coraliomargarita sp. J2-16]WPJ95364.1 ABC transporter substrate-binding protein [Coraliomargarita sp. J2-16]